MDGLDLLGAEIVQPRRTLTWTRGAIAAAAAAIGAIFVRKHPVLGALGAAALASNAHAVYEGDRTTKEALRRVGKHVIATVGSLTVPKYPAMGYVAGAVAADLFIDGEGGGIIEEWMDYEGANKGLHKKPDKKSSAIDVEFVETQSPGVALQKVT